MTASHAITKLTLENFRNYRALSLELPPQPVVLRGVNGAGKTNILEAISLLAPGRGLRGAKLRAMDKIIANRQSAVADAALLTADDTKAENSSPWAVGAQVVCGSETHFVGTGRDGDSAMEKRIVKINGEKIRGQATLSRHVCVQWLTPNMDQVFMEGGSARRKLLDRIVFGFAPEHAARVSAYEAAMRERNKLLSDRQLSDPYWLSLLEQQMAEHAVAITIARQDVLARLSHELVEDIAHFPRALMRLDGALEQWLAMGDSALVVEKKMAERLMESRAIDAARGRCALGPQRSELTVIHSKKNMLAEQCSTGEQKALLLSLVLAAARARANWCNIPPILLLDEVIAHLDVDKRACLFDLLRACRIQAWMTGTDAADFKGLAGFSTILDIDGGMVR